MFDNPICPSGRLAAARAAVRPLERLEPPSGHSDSSRAATGALRALQAIRGAA